MKNSRVLLGSCLLGLFAACGHKQLPPGTPPPEYQAPVLPPWSPDAGADTAPSTAEAPSEAEGGSVVGALPDDAGAAQDLGDGQNEVGGGSAFGQPAVQPEAHNWWEQHGQ